MTVFLTVFSAVASIVLLLLKYWLEKEKTYSEKAVEAAGKVLEKVNEARDHVRDGDIDTVAARLDRLSVDINILLNKDLSDRR